MLQQEESLVQKVRKPWLAWFGHATRMEGEWLPLRALHCHIEGKRSRQPKTWMMCIKEDLAEHTASSGTCKRYICVVKFCVGVIVIKRW